jgi:hypothetical protein
MHNPAPEAKLTSPRVTEPTSGLTHRAARWFLKSGIQQPSGGVARYYRTDTRKLQAVSTEITGYAAATLAYLYRLTGDAGCREAAVRAGRFLTRVAWDPALGTVPFECRPENGSRRAPAYFFDAGIIARGLMALWRATGEAEFLETATACARSMADDFRGPSGYHAALSLPEKQPLAADGRWSRQPGCYQLKPAMAWLETGAGRYTRLYEMALAGCLTTHSAFLDAEPDPERVMDRLHAYCYFLEGLLPRATQPNCAPVLRDGILRAGGLLREIGPSFERSDVCAQLLRLRIYAAALGVAPLDTNLAEEEAAKIWGYQLDDPDPRVHGAFSFGRRASEPAPFANPASTAFSVQALEMWRQHQKGEFQPDVLELI